MGGPISEKCRHETDSGFRVSGHTNFLEGLSRVEEKRAAPEPEVLGNIG
jgi:hypothetical protein